MDFREILDADIAQYEQNHRRDISKPVQDESVKTDVDPRRSKLIGEIMMKHFPELKCFRPQLNRAANAREFRPLEEFLDKFSNYEPVKTALEELVAKKQAEHETDESGADM